MPAGGLLRKPWLPAVVILALAVELRFLGLGEHSLWFDEAYSVLVARKPLPIIIQAMQNDTHPPLYYAVLHLWMGAFGSSEQAVRGLSAMLGVLTVLLLYVFARRIVGRDIALMSAVLLAGSAFAVHAAQEARMYPLLGLLALASWYALVLAVEDRRPRAWPLYVLSTALMLYTHYFGFLVVAAQVLYLLPRGWGERRVWREAALAVGAAVALFAPWIPVLAVQASSGRGWPTFRPAAGLESVAALLGLFGFGGELWGTSGYFHISFVPWWKALLVAAPVLTVVALGAYVLRGRRGLLLCYWAAPIAGTMLVSQRYNVFYPRYFSFLVAPFAILAAAGLDAVGSAILRRTRAAGIPRPALQAGLIVCVLALNAPVLNGFTLQPWYDWRGAAALVADRAGPNDFLLFVPEFAAKPFEYYYTGHLLRYGLTPVEVYGMVHVARRPDPQINKAWVRQLARSHPRLWIVATTPFTPGAYLRLRNLLDEGFAPGQAWDFNAVYVFAVHSRLYGREERPAPHLRLGPPLHGAGLPVPQ